jgi:hypothetical protein
MYCNCMVCGKYMNSNLPAQLNDTIPMFITSLQHLMTVLMQVTQLND